MSTSPAREKQKKNKKAVLGMPITFFSLLGLEEKQDRKKANGLIIIIIRCPSLFLCSLSTPYPYRNIHITKTKKEKNNSIALEHFFGWWAERARARAHPTRLTALKKTLM